MSWNLFILERSSSFEKCTIEEIIEPWAIEMRLSHWDSFFLTLGESGDQATLALLDVVVLLEVVNDSHVESFAIVYEYVTPTDFQLELFIHRLHLAVLALCEFVGQIVNFIKKIACGLLLQAF